MNADPFDKYVRLQPVPATLPGERDVVPAPVSPTRVAEMHFPRDRGLGGHSAYAITDETHLFDPTPPARAFAPADRAPAPPRVWPGGVRTLGPLLLIPGRSVHIDDLADAEQLHATLGEAIDHLRAEFGIPAVATS